MGHTKKIGYSIKIKHSLQPLSSPDISMPTAVVDLQNIVHNFQLISSQAPGCCTFAVVSADAFGHGAIPVSRILEPFVNGFAVSRPNEAFELRLTGILRPILVLAGAWAASDLRRLALEGCDVVCHSEAQLRLLEELKLERPCVVWLEVDPGQSTTGFRDFAKWEDAYRRLCQCPNVYQPPNFISRQATQLDRHILSKPGLKCFGSPPTSFFTGPRARKDVVRVSGSALYGIFPPRPDTDSGDDKNSTTLYTHIGLKPAMTLKAKLISIRFCDKACSPISDRKNGIDHMTKLGVVSIGYGDGYAHMVPSNTPMFVNGRPCNIVGQPGMDTTIIDLGLVHEDAVGDDVVVWGPEFLPLESLASMLECSPEVLVARLTRRVTRHFTGA